MEDRLSRLESQCRMLRLAVVGLSIAVLGSLWIPGSRAQQRSFDLLRVRALTVEDADGRPRVVLGPVDQQPSSRGVGLRINDASGVERFGLTLNERGAVVMGLDAPPGTGDDRNRERITFVADEKGGAAMRLKDRRTGVVSSWYLDDENRGWIEFSDYLQQPPRRRRVGLTGEETLASTK